LPCAILLAAFAAARIRMNNRVDGKSPTRTGTWTVRAGALSGDDCFISRLRLVYAVFLAVYITLG
jgi:hypothetical protein